jgi:hypothetical protein
MKRYILDLNKKQLSVIQKSLEFYSRFLAGQWRLPDALEWKEFELSGKDNNFWTKRNNIEDELRLLKAKFFNMHQNSFYGINSDRLCEEAKIAYDIYRPMLEQFVNEQKDEGENVNINVYSSPGSSYSREGRIKIKIQENDK